MPKENAKGKGRGKTRKEKNANEQGDYNTTLQTGEVSERLARLLYSLSSLCLSQEEATIISDEVISISSNPSSNQHSAHEIDVHQDQETINHFSSTLQDYFENLPLDQAVKISQLALTADEDESESSSDSGAENDNDGEDYDDDDDDDYDDDDYDDDDFGYGLNEKDVEYIGEGECELCERYIKLTRHHLVPKSTWPKLTKRIMMSASGDPDKVRVIFGDAFEDIPEVMDRAIVRKYLSSKMCDICRQCHNKVHDVHDLMTLATRYNSVEKLIQDKDIYKFCKWASKQRTGKYSKY